MDLRKPLAALGACLLLGSTSASARRSATPEPVRLGAVFIQLDRESARWPRHRWETACDSLERLGIRTLIVQWSRHDDIRYYGDVASGKEAAEGAAIRNIAEAAGQRGLGFYLGLYDDSAYWARIQGPPSAVEGYFGTLLERNLQVAAELSAWTAHPGFKGFYIPQEVDDVTWAKPEKARILSQYLGALGRQLKRVRPTAPVLVSAFFRGRTSPGKFAELWGSIAEKGALDALLLQDGAGAASTPPGELNRYASSLLESLAGRKVQLWLVIEAFEVLASAPGTFVARSASFERVKGQLAAAGPLSDTLVAFALGYVNPASEMPGAKELAAEYRRYLGGAP